MSVRIKFIGDIFGCFYDITPGCLEIHNCNLKINGTIIPVEKDRIFDLFYYLKRASRQKHGTVEIKLLAEGEIRIWSETYDTTIDYILTRIAHIGNLKEYTLLRRNITRVPDFDYYEIG